MRDFNPEKVTHKLVADFRKQMELIGKNKVVIGLSGGVDSAVVAALVAKSIGADNVFALYLPYKTTPQSSLADAFALGEKCGLRVDSFDISPVVDSFFATQGDVDRLRRGNAMSRIRMTAIFDKAQKEGSIVGGTSNKTELMLGYGTWYGDTASSINIIGTLYKCYVYSIAEFLGLPQSIISKKPSADLWDGQTDEDELGFSYAVADNFLARLLDDGADSATLANEFGVSITQKIIMRIKSNAFKRKLPVIIGTDETYFSNIENKLNKF